MEKRLIDADALIEFVEGRYTVTWNHDYDGGIKDACIDILNFIDNAPTVDAVPVVRCRDCRWWTKQEKSIQGRCALTGTYPTGGWYCGNGERRDDEIDRR